MLEIAIPGNATLRLTHLVLDFNGTLAVDGKLLHGVDESLRHLAAKLSIHVLTADATGTAAQALAGLPCALVTLQEGDQDLAKRAFVEGLGAARCVCIGNGRNDKLMLAVSALGIAVTQQEGASVQTLLAARVAAPDIGAALGLLIHPTRLAATLRV